MNTQRGFSLLELLIAAAVLAIVASIAVPSYRGHIVRVYRTEAVAQLMRIQTAQERFFLQNNLYDTGAALADLLSLPSGRYRFVVEVPDPAGGAVSFRVRAVAQGAQAHDERCAEMTINDRGERGAAPGAVMECWK